MLLQLSWPPKQQLLATTFCEDYNITAVTLSAAMCNTNVIMYPMYSVWYQPISHTCYRTLVITLHLKGIFFTAYACQLLDHNQRSVTVSLLHQEEFHLTVVKCVSVRDGSEVFHTESISGVGAGTWTVNWAVLELDSCSLNSITSSSLLLQKGQHVNYGHCEERTEHCQAKVHYSY